MGDGGKALSAGMPKSTVPHVRGSSKKGRRPRRSVAKEGVEVAGASGDHENSLSA